jgi:hypothetical protein
MLPAFFQRKGRWISGSDGLRFSPAADEAVDGLGGDTLYVFCVGDPTGGAEHPGVVVHVARTREPLVSRMEQYGQAGADRDDRFARIGRRLLAELEVGRVVEVHGFAQGQASLRWEGFEVNLPAGLHGSLLDALAPVWRDAWEAGDHGEQADEEAAGDEQPGVEEFRNAIREKIRAAAAAGLEYVEIRSGDLHDELGAVARHPACCQAMRSLHGPGDLILGLPRDREVNHDGLTFDQQRNGNRHSGANLVVRYRAADR